jgi:signal transduction histidine kinase
VLNYAKLDAGHVHYDMRDVALEEVLATCEALTAPQARARAVHVTFVGCPATLRVRADAEKVQQVVLNLLTNALKFTGAGGTVTLSCGVAPDRRTVAIHVADTGRGIAPEQLERVFQPFVQVDAQLTRTHEGVGLGLAISRDLARGMGGDLIAESEPGVGSTFTLLLPAAAH